MDTVKMKTITIDGTTYEITDDVARKAIVDKANLTDNTLIFLGGDETKFSVDLSSLKPDEVGGGGASIYVGPDEPQDPNVSIWVDTDGGPDHQDSSISITLNGQTYSPDENGVIALPKIEAGDSQPVNPPYIGENGHWFVSNEDTGVQAAGDDGITPHIGDNNHWYLGETDTGVVALGEPGKDGVTPTIGANGNWHIGETDTGIKATGENGAPGTPGTPGDPGVSPHIGANGNWFVGETDTGTKAQGEQGPIGIPGATYRQIAFTIPAATWVPNENGLYTQDISVESMTDSNGRINLNAAAITPDIAADAIKAAALIWTCTTSAGSVNVTALGAIDIDLPMIAEVYVENG